LLVWVYLKSFKNIQVFARWRQIKEIKRACVFLGDPFGYGEQEQLIKLA
jgi:hypothetical protein